MRVEGSGDATRTWWVRSPSAGSTSAEDDGDEVSSRREAMSPPFVVRERSPGESAIRARSAMGPGPLGGL
jgi:hypothetical protein